MALVALAGRFIRVNRAMSAIPGYSREQLLESRLHDLTHPDDLDADVEKLALSAVWRAGRAADARPRRLQGDQRHARAPHR
jgi:PAS domain S-box-containing protein